MSTPDPLVPDSVREDKGKFDVFTSEYNRLKAIEQEYKTTIQVVAVLAEIISTLTKGKAVEITDSMLEDPPLLTAWRDPARMAVVIETSRD